MLKRPIKSRDRIGFKVLFLRPALFSGLMLACFLGPLKARTAGLDLDQCFASSLKRSEEVANQRELIIQAEERFRQSKGGLMPSLNFSDTLSASGPFNKETGSPGSDQELRLSLDQPLFHGFKSISLYDQTRDLLTAQKEARRWSLLQLYYDTAQSFYSVLAFRKDLEHLTNMIRIYDRRIEELNNWVRIGRSRSSDLLSAKTARALIIAQTKQAEGELANAQSLFSFVTGLDPKTELKDREEGPSSAPSLTECLGSMKERPDLEAARNRSFAAYKGIKIAQSSRWPWLGLSGGVSLEKALSRNELSWDIQVVISYAIFSGNIISSKISEARSVARQSDLAYSSLVRTITNDIKMAHQTLSSGIEQKNAVADALSFAEKNYRQIETDYRLGIAKFTDLLLALSSWRDTRRSYDKLVYTIKLDSIRLSINSGRLKLP